MHLILLALLTAVLTVLLIGQVWDGVAPGAARLASSACRDNNNCTRDVLLGDDTCAHEYLAHRVPCQSACYATRSNTTYCNGVGACLGQASECLGTCTEDADCHAVLPLDTAAFWTHTDVLYAPHEMIHNWHWTCSENACKAMLTGFIAVHTVDVETGGAIVVAGAPVTDCYDYLNQTWARQTGMRDCIVAQRSLLSASLDIPTLVLDAVYDPVQPFACHYWYACSPSNQTFITLETPV